MKIRRLLIVTVAVLIGIAAVAQARSILEKKIWYITTNRKVGEVRFWAVFLGQYDCTLTRKAPGEEAKQIKATLNLQLMSSGYVEGNGYGSKGKVQSLPIMNIKNESGERKVPIDSIDYIYENGAKIRLITGEVGDVVFDIEGQHETARKFVLRKYELTDYYGEEILKGGSEEQDVIAIAFSKEGAQRALKASSGN